MNTTKNNFINWFFFLVLLSGSGFYLTSCSEDDGNFGTPTITQVRLTDPELKDSTFTASFRNRLIVVEGSNLNGATEIYMNDEMIPFNPTYVLPTSIILSIPEFLPFEGEDPSRPNTIRVVTPGGETTFNFTFLAPMPEIGIFKFAPPAVPGETMQIIGENFYNVESIIFTDEDSVVTSQVTDFEVNETFDIITFSIPSGATIDGLGIVITESGTAVSEYSSNPFPSIARISDDIQMPGATLSIYGKDFTFVDKVIFPGGLEVSIEDTENFKMNELFTQIDVTVPMEITEGGPIILGTEFGDEYASSINFFDFSGVQIAWDDVYQSTPVGWTWEKGSNVIPNGSAPPVYGTGTVHNMVFVGDNPWWVDPGTLALGFSEWRTPTGVTNLTPISQLALAFNYYNRKPWEGGYWKINWDNNGANQYNWMPYETEPVPIDKWVTYKIPLSDLIKTGGISTWGDIVAAGAGGESIFVQFGVDEGADPVEMNVYFDNFRIVKE